MNEIGQRTAIIPLLKRKMKKIRLFSYLDQYKMYSISSQVFEGLTEYALRYSGSERTERDEQKGVLGSGQVLADIASERTGTTEKRFLHDYAYTVFEERLEEEGRVLAISEATVEQAFKSVAEYSFVKVTGKALFNDIGQLTTVLGSYNDMAEALAYVSTIEERNLLRVALEQVSGPGNRDDRNALKAQLKDMENPARLAQAHGMHQDPLFLEKLANVLNYGYQGEFEVQIRLGTEESPILFSGVLNRDNFVEREGLLIRKYSRTTEKEFTLFGMVTQAQRVSTSGGELDELNSGPNPPNAREGIMRMVAALTLIEDTFVGRLPHEVIIDPIALYREL